MAPWLPMLQMPGEKVYNGSMEKIDLDRMKLVLSGGKGSGNFGHAGRPGKRGGSAPGKGEKSTAKKKYGSILDHLREKGGFSYQPVLEAHAANVGFIVSPYAERSKIIPAKDITEKDLIDYVDANWDLLKDEGIYFGGWYNQKDGNMYLDISIPIETLEEANALAVKHKQRAFYDLLNDREIETVWPEGQEPEFHD